MTKPLRIDGVDISHWQSGKIDWHVAKRAGVKFVYHKATEGKTYRDPNYSKRRTEAKAAGMPFGAYHFARAKRGKGQGTAEAKFFLSVAKPDLSRDLRPALDLETTEGLSMTELRAWAKEFIDHITKETGAKPVVYTPYDLGTVDDGCIIWRPRYNNTNTPPALKWDIWQFSNGVYGVPKSVVGFGNVDLNHFRDGLTVNHLLIKGEPAPASTDRMDPKAYFVGAKGPHVRWLANRLIAHGYGRFYKNGPDQTFTKGEDQKAVRRFQRHQGWRGKNADGLPGKETLKRLAARPPHSDPESNPMPTPQPQTKKPVRLKFAHVSLQFSDTNQQHTHDIEKIFKRKYDVITGTEAGPGAGNTASELRRCAKKYGYKINVPNRYDTWVAVKSGLVTGKPVIGNRFALWRSSKTIPKPPGRFGDKGVVWIRWNMGKDFGAFMVGSVHYLTNKGAGKSYKAKSDRVYAEAIEAWAAGRRSNNRLFVAGDFNLNDKNNDVFKGEADFVTCWDELKKWPNTGHGPIDAIARDRNNKNVKLISARSLSDKDLFLHTDHFVVEAVYEVGPIQKKKKK